MTTDQMIAELTTWRDRIVESDEAIENLLEPLMLSPESPLYQIIWSLQGAYTKATAVIVGDHWEWLDWFASETNMGRNAKGVCPGKGKPRRVIETIADLAWLIEESK